MKGSRVWSPVVGVVAFLYFVIPLVATAEFSVQEGPSHPFWAAYSSILSSPQFWSSLRLSLFMAVSAVVIGLVIIVPATYWAFLRAPRLQTWVEFISIMPFVVPPIVLVLGLVHLYGNGFGPLSSRPIMLMAAYGVISMPYLFRSVNNGLRSMDVRSLTEAALSLGSSWPRVLFQVVFPNLRTALLGGTFLVFALIMGEYAMSSMLGLNTFGVYMLLTGETRAHAAAALALISLALVWFLVGVMQAVNRGNVTIGGAR